MEESLFIKSAKGVFWTGGAQVIGQLMHLAIRLILARLLVPEDFGLVAMAMVVVSFTWWFLDLSFGQALIQRKDLTEAHKSTAFWSNVAAGILLFIVLSLLSALVTGFFKTDKLTAVFIALSFSVVLLSPETTLSALMQRDFDYRSIALRKAGSIFFGGSTGIILALNNFGVWALVGDALMRSLSGSLLLFVQSRWRPKLIFDVKAFQELWKYSRSLIGARILNYFNRNLDTILIGRFLGPVNLGLYNLGYQFVLLPLTYISRSINTVLFASLSKLQDKDEQFKNAYIKSLQMISFVTFPLMTTLAVSADVFIPSLLGEKWMPSVPLIPLFSMIGLIHSLHSAMPAVFQARGETALFLRMVIYVFIGNAIAFTVGLRWGILGVAFAYLAINVLLTPVLLSSVLRVMDMNWSRLFKALSPAVMSTLVLIIFWIITGAGFSYFVAGYNPLMILVFQIFISGIIYLLVSWRINPVVKEALLRLRIIPV